MQLVADRLSGTYAYDNESSIHSFTTFSLFYKLTHTSPFKESFEQLTYDPSIDTKRGGLCIHKPTNQKAQDEFLAFSRNIQLQTPNSTTHFTERADYLWQKALEENKYKVLKKVVVEKKKRGRKRKLVEKEDSSISEISAITGNSVDESMDVSTHDCEADVNEDVETSKDIAMGLEEDDQMLEFLHRKGDDNNHRAKFLAMVTLCRGTGTYQNILTII